ncbi:hypothetical protein [Dickeya lacustris]|uniref:Uncharacterized protein n=1 Tax=Dickeya lacustris TaxID=2259638 RepID=A0ABY8G959_9GAMM|nr:hypothetical protein [Dickeya lacustris]WFN56498.1 hypothetical protein O1Q98_04185 [Dickeya lacustris]
MLTAFWRTLRHWTLRPRKPVHTRYATGCSECEYSFYNHQATLPFDQIDECLRARRDALTQHHGTLAERYHG